MRRHQRWTPVVAAEKRSIQVAQVSGGLTFPCSQVKRSERDVPWEKAGLVSFMVALRPVKRAAVRRVAQVGHAIRGGGMWDEAREGCGSSFPVLTDRATLGVTRGVSSGGGTRRE